MFWKRSSSVAAPSIPEGVRVYAVGDIHGRVDLLENLHAIIQRDAVSRPIERTRIIYLGDYVDRGLHSREVIEALASSPLAGFEPTYLKGNHEMAMLRSLEDPDFISTWMQWGGDATLASYGVRVRTAEGKRRAAQEIAQDFAGALPPHHRQFLERLELMSLEGSYVFVHAGVRPGLALEAQREEDVLMIRDEFLFGKTDPAQVIVFGHTIFEAPYQVPGKLGVDTGAFASGCLTAAVIEGMDVRFLSTKKEQSL